MDHGFDGLDLTHAGAYSNSLCPIIVITVGATLNVLGIDGNRTDILQRIEQFVIVFHVSGQFIDADHWKLSAFCLLIGEHADHPETGDLNDLFIRSIRSIFLHLVPAGSQNADSFFSFADLPVELPLPCPVACNQRGGRVLHGNQKTVVQRIVMKFAHAFQHFPVLVAFKYFLHAFLQPVGDLPDLLLPALPFRTSLLLFIQISFLLSAAGLSETSAHRCNPFREQAAHPGCGTVRSACR